MKKNSYSEKNRCPVCQNRLIAGCLPWHWICEVCRYEHANFQPNLNKPQNTAVIDERARALGLKPLRQENFKAIIKKLVNLKPNGGELLEVGSGHGWFLDLAKQHFKVLGIEPDQGITKEARKSRLAVREGYFPEAMKQGELFDVIIFNDVFEHISDAENVVIHCSSHLKPEGLLILNLPNSKGIFYYIAKNFCCRLGSCDFFARLWQKDLPSPHLHYFNVENLTKLTKKYGFIPIQNIYLSTIHFRGLYSRIAYAPGFNLFQKIIIYCILVLIFPLFKLLPRDAMCIIFQKN